MTESSWRPTGSDPLLILAMDHRASFGKSLFGVHDDEPTDPQREAMQHAKQLIYAGLQEAVGQLTGGRPGVLVDQRYGQAVVDEAAADQVVLVVPVERSGRDWFELEYGPAWRDRLQAARAQYAKVLVRDNPAFAADQRRLQFERLRPVSVALHADGIPLIYELVVPPTAEQLASVGGAAIAYDRDVRPDLVVSIIADNQAAGVEPAIWKIEGLETTQAAADVVAQIRAGGRTGVDAIVLGRDAPAERLTGWLEVAARVDGFVGFAIGRSIWEEPIRANGDHRIDDTTTSARICAQYLAFARGYLDASRADRPRR